MEILKNNYNKPKTTAKTVTCEQCESELRIDEDDIKIGEFGVKYYNCPLCNHDNYLDDSIPLTSDNIVYPIHFMSFENGVKATDADINKWIKESISTLNSEIDCCYTGYGDTLVIAFKDDKNEQEATVIVAKNYQESFVKISEEKFKI